MDPVEREKALQDRLERIDALERELKARESAKKQVPLRLSATLWNELAAWAEDDFRSVNGQIEYILTEAVRRRRGRREQQ